MKIKLHTTFEALHHWPNAPEEVEFLRNSHRHLFHIYLSIQVFSDDRELEFFMVKRWLDGYLDNLPYDLGETSCEMLGKKIIEWTLEKYGKRKIELEVSEDDEVGAIVTEKDLK